MPKNENHAHAAGSSVDFNGTGPNYDESVENRSTSLTDRVKNDPDTTDTQDGENGSTDWGIDTVKLSFRTSADNSYTWSPFWTSSRTRNRPNSPVEDETYIGCLSLRTGDVRATLYVQNNICHVEFNAARLTHGKSEQLLDPDFLHVWAKAIIEALAPHAGAEFIRYDENGEETWDSNWQSRVQIKRLDIARNFLVSNPDLVKHALPLVQAKYQRVKQEYQNSGGGWTLVNGTQQAGTDRMYDKEAELAQHAIECRFSEAGSRVFRFEAQLQKDRLKRYGLTRLSDVTADRAWKALEGRWEATGWGTGLPGPSGLLEAVEGLSPLVKERMLGFLLMEAEGVSPQVLSPSQVATRRKEAKDIGLVPGMPLTLLGAPSQHLDLHTGRLEPLPASPLAS